MQALTTVSPSFPFTMYPSVPPVALDLLESGPLFWRVYLTPGEARAHLAKHDPTLVALVDHIVRLFRITDDRPSIAIGKEYSRVIYVNAGLLDDDSLRTFRALCENFDVEEFTHQSPEGAGDDYRLWWK